MWLWNSGFRSSVRCLSWQPLPRLSFASFSPYLSLYLLLNLVGSLVFAVLAYVEHQWDSLLLDGVGSVALGFVLSLRLVGMAPRNRDAKTPFLIRSDHRFKRCTGSGRALMSVIGR